MPESISCLAPAKLNLALHVTGQRADGYHLIDSLVAFADFGDHVTVAPADADEFVVAGHFAATVPIDSANLVIGARDLLRRHHPKATAIPVAITLEKKLPVASGVGGGSSDAAAALKALSRFWGVEMDATELATLALELGADLPMCLSAMPLVASGIGDEIKPVVAFPAIPAVIVNAGLPVSTPAVFAELQTRANTPLPCFSHSPDLAALHSYLGGTRNDLQAPAISLCPMIDITLDSLTGNGALFARMSGSGATCFGLFKSADAARDAARIIGANQPGWFVEACTIRGTEPQADDRN